MNSTRAATGQLVVVGLACVMIASSALAGTSAIYVGPAAAVLALIGLTYRRVLAWPSLVTVLLILVLFIPIRRYTVPLNLPFQLEPYRVFVVMLATAWVVSLLIDSRVRARASGFEGPLLLIGASFVGSVVANEGRVQELQVTTEVVKSLTFWLSFVIVFYVLVTVIRTAEDVQLPVRIIVAGGAILGFFGVIESKTGFNPFDNLSKVVPFLVLDDSPSEATTFRAGLTRAYGSAQHPIAFGAALAMLLPLAFYVAYRAKQARWWIAFALVLLGSLTSVSRTSAVMIITSGVVILLLRRETRRLLPYLLPLAVVIQLALPGTLSTFKAMFFPQGGLVAEQASAGVGQSRVTSFGPALTAAAQKPILGEGYGTRIVTGNRQNSFILDDAWLGVLLETGIVGLTGWIWLFWRFGRKAAREARSDLGERGWLLTVLCAAVTSYAVGMLFYDAFSFIQVTILMFILLGLGASLILSSPSAAPAHDEAVEES